MTERHVIPHNRHRYLIELYICIALQVHVSKGKNLSMFSVSTCTIASRLCHLHVASTYECNSIPFYIFYKRFCGIPPGPFCLSNQINISQHQTLYSHCTVYKDIQKRYSMAVIISHASPESQTSLWLRSIPQTPIC